MLTNPRLMTYACSVSDQRYNLAIESSTRTAAVAIGRVDETDPTGATGGNDQPIACAPDELPQLEGVQRSSELMIMIEQLCHAHSIEPSQIGEIYISVGPGSFTGLRIGIATVKAITQVTGAKIVAVPTLDVVAQNTPDDVEHVAVCLNQKRDTVYAGLFEKTEGDNDISGHRQWTASEPASLCTLTELIEAGEQPLALLGDPLPPLADSLAENVTVLPADLAQPKVKQVWHIGQAMAKLGQFIDPMALVPLYVRPPEAVELWEKRKTIKK